MHARHALVPVAPSSSLPPSTSTRTRPSPSTRRGAARCPPRPSMPAPIVLATRIASYAIYATVSPARAPSSSCRRPRPSPSAVALIVLTPSRPRPPKTNAAPLGIRLPRVIRWATRGAARLNRATTATSPPPPARASLLNGVSPHRPPSASRWGRAPARDGCATLTRRSHEGALTGPEGTEALTSWRRGDPRFR